MKLFSSDPRISRTIKRLALFDGVFLIIFCGIFLSIAVLLSNNRSASSKKIETVDSPQCSSYMTIIRNNDFGLTHPLLLADLESESPTYMNLKVELSKTIQSYIKKGDVQSVSVYVRQMNNASWMSINGNQCYLPGSMMKVPIMLYYLKEEQKCPGILNKELYYEKPQQSFPEQAYKGDSIKPHRSYKVSELLRYMIEESDNNATFLLSKNLKPDSFRKIFTELDIPPDEFNDIKYQINVKDYEKFFRVLYNATFINEKLSQYGLDLLTHSKFMDGIARKLPDGTIIARKFGERGIDTNMDFSEGGIVYKDSNPYILVIMTKGTNQSDQVNLISELSLQVFKRL